MPPRGKIERPQDRRGVILRLLRYMMRYKGMLFLAVALTVSSNLLQLVGPTLCGLAIDAVEGGPGHVDFARVFLYAGWMVAFYAASSVLSFALSLLMIRISQRITRQMRKDVFDRLMELPVSYFDRTQTGDILSRISYDIDTVNASLSSDLVQILTSLITVVGALLMMIRLSPKLVLVFCVTVPASILLTRYMTGKVRPLFRRRSASLGELNAFVEEMVSGQRTLRAYRREQNVQARFAEKNEDAVQSYYRAEYYGSMVGPCVNLINNISLSLISVMGALLYLAGGIRPDQRGGEHPQRAAERLRRSRARVPPDRRAAGARGRAGRTAAALRTGRGAREGPVLRL